MAEKPKQHWIPLESNPDVLNKYIENLGVPKNYEFVDVFGLDKELLGMVPRPVLAVVLLYPITDKSKETAIGEVRKGADGVYFVKQTIGNACGTVAIVHALANNKIPFKEGAPFSEFMKATADMSPEDKAKQLESDPKMGASHAEIAEEGQTKAPAAEDKVNTHFVTFICQGGNIFELNGSAEGPVYHRETSPDSLIEDVAGVVQKFMSRDPTEVNFNLMALVRKEDD